ncbi:uncharacterized protein EV420DRAFT_1705247 [Desarmillaria tabescens]|uniref:Uncharacterized protein n=1 Tax=Armillaria tabescens TaxID=1929756 RepID=A0AA39JZE5_ARMTA|nr:uncharacterized protein EV420DRAFT_1705247 [Desarmillaria tabescens]KAK0450581.1 hypothetical protein EV420DRAFT_1705247 [Desarmillaria tabescens]
MPRSRSVKNISISSANSFTDAAMSLTPRTPQYRSGRTEEGSQVEPQEVHGDEDDPQSSTAPLLSADSSDMDEPKGGRVRATAAVSKLPIVFLSVTAGFLFFLMVVAYWHPGTLEWYLGVPVPSFEQVPVSTETNDNLNSSLIISYENYTSFPLSTHDYLVECYKMHPGGFMPSTKFWEPSAEGVMDVVHGNDKDVCSSTITYMLDGKVGLLADLALIAQAAALARERNRTFFVDDTYWNRGRWIDHFEDVRETQPGPEPGCKPPPPQEYVACPRHARHWIITSRTAKFHFGHMYYEHYEDGYAHSTNRLKPIYDFAAGSLRNTIIPNTENARLINSAREEVAALSSTYLSAHLRRGDRKPSSYSYHGSYVPTKDFVDALDDAASRLQRSDHPFLVYLASDSPAMMEEMSSLLSPVYSLSRSANAELKSLVSPGEYFQRDFDKYDLETRVSATRGMIVDFAFLSGAWSREGPDAVVCTVSSAVCKLSAVALGWEKAFGHVDNYGLIDRQLMGWVDVDQKGRIIPEWAAFDLFN